MTTKTCYGFCLLAIIFNFLVQVNSQKEEELTILESLITIKNVSLRASLVKNFFLHARETYALEDKMRSVRKERERCNEEKDNTVLKERELCWQEKELFMKAREHEAQNERANFTELYKQESNRVAILTREKEELLEIKWVNIARGYIEEFETTYYKPTQEERQKINEDIRKQLNILKMANNPGVETELKHAKRFEWILQNRNDFLEVKLLREELDKEKVEYSLFSSSMGLGFVLLSKRIHVLLKAGAMGSVILPNVIDRKSVNKMIKIFLSQYDLKSSNLEAENFV